MIYEYWFANIKGIGDKKKREIRSRVECAKALYNIEETALRKIVEDEKSCHKILESVKEWKVDESYQKLQEKQIEFVTIQDKQYPEKLKEISAPPYALYVRGTLPNKNQLSVAMVGARNCSAYGETMAKTFAEELARCGVQIISGMAHGVDGVSQMAALNAGGTTFGVLGNGVDICYPRENFSLYMEIPKHGGLISEQPPGTRPLRQFFPARNRIISGLADVVLVIEAKEKSGSLITADMALEQGKDVYALPGQINNMLSKGCHNLIKQGAEILLSPEEFVEDLGIFHKLGAKKITENKILLESTENIVYSCLDFEPRNINQILKMTGFEIQTVMNCLLNLELKGYIREISKNYYVKVK